VSHIETPVRCIRFMFLRRSKGLRFLVLMTKLCSLAAANQRNYSPVQRGERPDDFLRKFTRCFTLKRWAGSYRFKKIAPIAIVIPSAVTHVGEL
jgi:hypothetical protein